MNRPNKVAMPRIVAELDALQAEVDALKRLQAESGQCPQPTLDALLPAILDKAFTRLPGISARQEGDW